MCNEEARKTVQEAVLGERQEDVPAKAKTNAINTSTA